MNTLARTRKQKPLEFTQVKTRIQFFEHPINLLPFAFFFHAYKTFRHIMKHILYANIPSRKSLSISFQSNRLFSTTCSQRYKVNLQKVKQIFYLLHCPFLLTVVQTTEYLMNVFVEKPCFKKLSSTFTSCLLVAKTLQKSDFGRSFRNKVK